MSRIQRDGRADITRGGAIDATGFAVTEYSCCTNVIEQLVVTGSIAVEPWTVVCRAIPLSGKPADHGSLD